MTNFFGTVFERIGLVEFVLAYKIFVSFLLGKGRFDKWQVGFNKSVQFLFDGAKHFFVHSNFRRYYRKHYRP